MTDKTITCCCDWSRHARPLEVQRVFMLEWVVPMFPVH